MKSNLCLKSNTSGGGHLVAGQHALDESEFDVLSLITGSGAEEPSAIAGISGLPEPTIHHITDHLIALNLAVLKRYPIDPRIHWLVPTMAGEDMVRHAAPTPCDPASRSHPTAA